VPRKVLLDTGVVVALVNAADPDHARCREVWGRLRARIFTVEGSSRLRTCFRALPAARTPRSAWSSTRE